jgi:hypothetical protein
MHVPSPFVGSAWSELDPHASMDHHRQQAQISFSGDSQKYRISATEAAHQL